MNITWEMYVHQILFSIVKIAFLRKNLKTYWLIYRFLSRHVKYLNKLKLSVHNVHEDILKIITTCQTISMRLWPQTMPAT